MRSLELLNLRQMKITDIKPPESVIRSLPQSVYKLIEEFIVSEPESLEEKISINTLQELAGIAKNVSVSETQNLIIGIDIKNFLNKVWPEITQRANGRMASLRNCFISLCIASYGKEDLNALIIKRLREQQEIITGLEEDLQLIAHGVCQNLIILALNTKTFQTTEQVKEDLKKLAIDEEWQTMIPN